MNYRNIFIAGLSSHQQALDKRHIDSYLSIFTASHQNAPRHLLVPFLIEQIDILLADHDHVAKERIEFLQNCKQCTTTQESHDAILSSVHALSLPTREQRSLKKHLRRSFDLEAMDEFILSLQQAYAFKLRFLVERLGCVVRALLKEATDLHLHYKALDRVLLRLFQFEGDVRVRVAGFQATATILEVQTDSPPFSQRLTQLVYRESLERDHHIWVQIYALSALRYLDHHLFKEVLDKRLSRQTEDDDIFVRRSIVDMLDATPLSKQERLAHLNTLAQDPSPYVRQGLTRQFICIGTEETWKTLQNFLVTEASPEVYAAALRDLYREVPTRISHDDFLSFLAQALKHEGRELVLRTILHLIGSAAYEHHISADHELTLIVHELSQAHSSVRVQRWAAAALLRVQCFHCKRTAALYQATHPTLSIVQPGKHTFFRSSVIGEFLPQEWGIVLSTIALDDFGFDVHFMKKRVKVTKGYVKKICWWRLMHELRTPSTDKREGYHHTKSRSYSGALYANSNLLAELTKTNVPGEPLYLPEEDGYRPFLPLPDQVLSLLARSYTPKTLEIYSPLGVTQITTPSFAKSLKAYCILSLKFHRYAQLRNWKQSSATQDAGRYIHALEKLGCVISFTPHKNDITLPEKPNIAPESVSRFFTAASVSALSPHLWDEFKSHFVSLYKNSLSELALFAACITIFFVGWHIKVNLTMRRMRNSIPLVIGGWGTRGKSGTERLKAALFNSLGYGILSKSSGCEAMILTAHPFCKLKEFFLFRPYEKATIWEQCHVVQLAKGYKPHVFLWECMGLNPRYVRILQHQWMRDDISTITNAYPDHEDIQGPAGVDVAETISVFIPKRGNVLCSEEQMLPVIRNAAHKVDADLTTVSWLDAGTLTPDILGRFPYHEHPTNIALVVRLARELGYTEMFALKELSDYVVPDLGVLKTFPEACIGDKKLQFINGMSANERYGCMSNWDRLQLGEHEALREPEKLIVTLVNNRADRVPRSRVFASMIVNDLRADAHVLIGNNLEGLQGFINEFWKERLDAIEEAVLNHPSSLVKQAKDLAFFLKIALSPEDMQARLVQLLGHVEKNPQVPWDNTEELKEHFRANEQAYSFYSKHLQSYETLTSLLEEEASSTTIEEKWSALREMFTIVFNDKFIVVEDYHATGNQVLTQVLDVTPPHFTAVVMGLQNIKGTGLDFVYRWVAWEQCKLACDQLRSGEVPLMKRAIEELLSFREYSLLSTQYVEESLAQALALPSATHRALRGKLDFIAQNHQRAMDEVHEELKQTTDHISWSEKIVETAYVATDIWKSILRKNHASDIYLKLSRRLISNTKAQTLLRNLYYEQK